MIRNSIAEFAFARLVAARRTAVFGVTTGVLLGIALGLGLVSVRFQNHQAQHLGEAALALAAVLQVQYFRPRLRSRFRSLSDRPALIWTWAAIATLTVCFLILCVEIRYSDFSLTLRMAESLGTTVLVLLTIGVVLQWREQFGSRTSERITIRHAIDERASRLSAWIAEWIGGHPAVIAAASVALLTIVQVLAAWRGPDQRLFGAMGEVWDALWSARGGGEATRLLGYPIGAVEIIRNPGLVRLFRLTVHAGAAWNTLVAAEFVVGAAAMWRLALRLSGRRWIATAAALVFSFGPAHISALYHEPTIYPWLPVFALAAMSLIERPGAVTAASWLLAGVLASLLVPAAAAALLLLTAAFGLGGVTARSDQETRRLPAIVIAGLIAAAVVTASFLAAGANAPVRNSVSTISFVLPPASVPLLGGASVTLGRPDILRPTFYAGIVPLLLAAYAVWTSFRPSSSWFAPHRSDISERCALRAFAVILFVGAAGAFAGTGPGVRLFPSVLRSVFTPGAMADRVWAPAVVFAIVGIATAGARRVRTSSHWLAAAFGLGILIDVMAYPAGPAPAIASPQQSLYRYLGAGSAIVEYPFVPREDPRMRQYLAAQINHRVPMLNGLAEGSAASQIRQAVIRPDAPGSASLLRSLGMTHVMVHADAYLKGSVPLALRRLVRGQSAGRVSDDAYQGGYVPDLRPAIGYKPIDSNGLMALFQIEAPPLAVWGGHLDADFFPLEPLDGEPVHWMKGAAGNYVVFNATGRPQPARFVFDALSAEIPRALDMSFGGGASARIQVLTHFSAGSFAFTLPPGLGVVRLAASPGPSRLGDMLGADDDRRVSIAFRSAKVELADGER